MVISSRWETEVLACQTALKKFNNGMSEVVQYNANELFSPFLISCQLGTVSLGFQVSEQIDNT